jgi:hypothetical protein
MCSLLLFQPHQLGLWSTSQLSPWSWSFRMKIGVFFRCLLSKVIVFVLIRNIISIVFWYYPLFVAICVIWLPGLTYGVYPVLFLKPGATHPNQPPFSLFSRKLGRCTVTGVAVPPAVPTAGSPSLWRKRAVHRHRSDGDQGGAPSPPILTTPASG